MTLVRLSSAGATTPQGGGQAVALAILCTLLFLTFLDNTIVLGALVNAQLHADLVSKLTRSMARVMMAGLVQKMSSPTRRRRSESAAKPAPDQAGVR